MSIKEYSYYTVSRFARSVFLCANSPYFWACLVYLLYSQMAVETRLHAPDVRERLVGNNHVLLGIARALISCMNILTWKADRSWVDSILFPDYLDLFSSIWLLLSSLMYTRVVDQGSSSGLVIIRRIESAAWFLEFLASLGWIFSWYYDYMDEFGKKPKPTPGRGWTLDDPDITALLTNVLSSSILLSLNLNLLMEINGTSAQEYSSMLITGDRIFLFNAWVYLIASMRCNEVFWFMPSWGTLQSFDEIMATDRDLRKELTYIHRSLKSGESSNNIVLGISFSENIHNPNEEEQSGLLDDESVDQPDR